MPPADRQRPDGLASVCALLVAGLSGANGDRFGADLHDRIGVGQEVVMPGRRRYAPPMAGVLDDIVEGSLAPDEQAASIEILGRVSR